jgi:hypothetical protein
MYCTLHKRPVDIVAFYTKECRTCDKLVLKEERKSEKAVRRN